MGDVFKHFKFALIACLSNASASAGGRSKQEKTHLEGVVGGEVDVEEVDSPSIRAI